MEKHSHFNYQCLKCRKPFSRCYNHNKCQNLQMQDFVLMDPDGEREGATKILFDWKRNKCPICYKKSKVVSYVI